MTEEKTKTHWQATPNKNYLGHWDLPNGNDIIVTIKSAGWEEVKNPIINTSEARRVIRFEEKGIKPFICNEGNSKSIIRSTGQSYMEDSVGFKIKLFASSVRVKGQEVDCLRIREIPQSELQAKLITDEQIQIITRLIPQAGKTIEYICKIMKVETLSNISSNKFEGMCKRLVELARKNGNN